MLNFRKKKVDITDMTPVGALYMTNFTQILDRMKVVHSLDTDRFTSDNLVWTVYIDQIRHIPSQPRVHFSQCHINVHHVKRKDPTRGANALNVFEKEVGKMRLKYVVKMTKKRQERRQNVELQLLKMGNDHHFYLVST